MILHDDYSLLTVPQIRTPVAVTVSSLSKIIQIPDFLSGTTKSAVILRMAGKSSRPVVIWRKQREILRIALAVTAVKNIVRSKSP